MRTMKILLVLVLIAGLTLPVTAVAGPGNPILPTGEDEDGGNSISYPVIWADIGVGPPAPAEFCDSDPDADLPYNQAACFLEGTNTHTIVIDVRGEALGSTTRFTSVASADRIWTCSGG